MRKFFTQTHLLLIVMLTCSAVGFGQTTVFSDDFNRAALSPGGTPANTYTSTLVPNVTATTGTFLRVGSGATGPVNGISYVSGNNAAFAAPYNTILAGNSGTVTWTFNLRWNRASGSNPAAPASGAYSTVAVLAGTSPALTTGNGYAIVYGNSLTPDPIRLVAYTGGITGALTPICTSGVSDLALT
ncbi:MAG: hypothetical protein JWQ78_2215, partial [Sediminibacterium sp.]|nr:hypothetical protein [Sediminibacterium sp.]